MTNKEILILGEFSSGKTAFINMLLGYPVLPEKMTSTDLPVVKIESGKGSGISYITKEDKAREVTSWQQTPFDWNTFSFLNVFIKKHPLLDTGITIYDTPGINTTNTHHLEHIEKFLNTNPKNYQLVLFFIPDKLSKTSVDFLAKWKSKFKNIMLVTNIKDVKSDSECRQIEKSIKRTVMSELSSTPIHLLSIGDLYEQFFENHQHQNKWEAVTDWQNKLDQFNRLIEKNIESIIGEDLFEVIWAISEKVIEPEKNYSKLTDNELDELIKYDDSQAMFEMAHRFAEKDMYGEAIPLLRGAVKFNNSDAENLLGACYENGLGVTPNINVAIKFYKNSAKNNNHKGLLNLGLYYLNHEEEKNWEQAFTLIKISAELGNQQAEFELGILYLDKRKYDEEKAFSLINRAVESKIPEAYSRLAFFYHIGAPTIKEDIKKAIELYKIGVEYEDPLAMFWLYMFSEDELIDFKTDNFFSYIQKAAEANMPEAQFCFAIELEERNNYSEAFKWYKKAAYNGDVDAQFRLGLMYFNGNGVAIDSQEAIKWYKKAANQGNADAKVLLGKMYIQNKTIAQNHEEAVEWLRLLAEQGNGDAKVLLGQMYIQNKTIAQNHEEAIEWLRLLEKQGNFDARLELGKMYIQNKAIAQNHEEVIEWLRLLAEQGNSDARLELGKMFIQNKTIAQNDEEVIEWLRLLAEQGNSDAQFELGQMYYLSQGVPQNYFETKKYFRLSAEQGNNKAQCELGYLYFFGNGVAVNYTEAKKWFRLSAMEGNSNAINALHEFRKELKNN